MLMEKSSPKQVLPLPEPARNFAMRGISALIAPVTRPTFQKRAPAAYQIMADWEMLAGPEISNTARPVKFAGGTLTLACSGPAAMELQYRSDMLIQRLNAGLGGNRVERLRFLQEALPASAAAVQRPPKTPPTRPAGLPEGALGEALAKLHQGIASRRE
jgi:hypothetical protein